MQSLTLTSNPSCYIVLPVPQACARQQRKLPTANLPSKREYKFTIFVIFYRRFKVHSNIFQLLRKSRHNINLHILHLTYFKDKVLIYKILWEYPQSQIDFSFQRRNKQQKSCSLLLHFSFYSQSFFFFGHFPKILPCLYKV